jgi:hypothetical protein
LHDRLRLPPPLYFRTADRFDGVDFLASSTVRRIENILDGFAGVKPHCFAGWDFDGLSASWIARGNRE